MCVCVSALLFCQTLDTSLTHVMPSSSHHNEQMVALIYAAGHRIVFRAPYYPVDGIEYVFNTIQGILRIRMDAITDGTSLLNKLLLAIASIPSFEPYFVNCGFINNQKTFHVIQSVSKYICYLFIFFSLILPQNQTNAHGQISPSLCWG